MKRPVAASIAVLLAFAGRGLPQSPNRLPDAPAIPLKTDGVPGRAAVVVPDSPAVISGEKLKNEPKKDDGAMPAPAMPATAALSSNAAACGSAACGSADKLRLMDTHSGPPEQFWVRFSYLNWWVQDTPMPAVLGVQTAVNPLTGLPVGETQTIGGGVIDYGSVSGVRLEGGMWLDCQHTCGVEFGAFYLQRQGRDFGFPDVPNQQITRPYFNTLTNVPANIFVAAPDPLNGSLTVHTDLRLNGADINLTRNLFFNGCVSLDALFGVRYLELTENLEVNQTTTGVGNALYFNVNQTGPAIQPNANTLTISDRIHTRNQLWAGQVGARIEARSGIWFGQLTGKVALGPNSQKTEISGSTTANTSTTPVSGGFLALPTADSGYSTTRWFAVSPEVGVTVGAQVSRAVRVHAGYNFLYINNVIRPADAFTTNINPRFLPSSEAFGTASGPMQQLPASRDDFIAHGVELGVTLTY